MRGKRAEKNKIIRARDERKKGQGDGDRRIQEGI